MSRPVTVAVLGPAPADFRLAQQSAWASLPLSLTAADPDRASLLAIDGRSSDWVDIVAAALTNRRPDGGEVAGLVVVRPSAAPGPARVGALADQAARAGRPVVVESIWAGHAAVADLAVQRVDPVDPVTPVVLVDLLALVAPDDARSSADVLLDELALVRAVVGPVDRLSYARGDAHGFTVDGRSGAAPVALGAVRSAGRPGARLSAYTATGEVQLEVFAEGTGAPATAWTIDADGEHRRPSWHESAARATWRRLHAAHLSGRTEASDVSEVSDLAALAGDLELVAAAGCDL